MNAGMMFTEKARGCYMCIANIIFLVRENPTHS